jgi:hypothetical protein
VRVEPRARPGVLAGPVEVEFRFRLLDQRLVLSLQDTVPPRGLNDPYCGEPVRPLTAIEMTLRTTATMPSI